MGTDIHSVFQTRNSEGKWENIPSEYEERRHYQLFAVLADVRNGYGFAGILTGESVTPIAPPRGLPADFEYDEDAIDWGSDDNVKWMGDHSHSWLSADEILEWAKNAPVVEKIGILSRQQYEAWDGETRPPAYCGGISGPGVSVAHLPNGGELPASYSHAQVTWKSALFDECAYFVDEVRRLKELYGDVRMVFGFDS